MDPRENCPWKCKHCLCYQGEIERLTTENNEVKEQILNRLHKRVGVCNYCGKQGCGHPNTNLPLTLKLNDVLWAINLDNLKGPQSHG